MKLTVDDYNFIQKILLLPKNKINEFDFPELKSSQFKYKINKINYLLKILQKDFFYKRNNNYFIKNKEILNFLIQNLDFSQFNKSQRKNIILNKLLVDQFIKINNLTNEFSQSRTSIKNDLEALECELAPFSLKLEYKHSHGIFIQGKEKQIRLFFLSHWLNFFEFFNYDEIKIEIDRIVFELLKGKNSSFETAKVLTIVLYIQFYRIKNNNFISELSTNVTSEGFENIPETTVELLKGFLNNDSIIEQKYFLNYFKGLCYAEVSNIFNVLYPEFKNLYNTFTEELSNTIGENLLEDEFLNNHLESHIQAAIFKLTNRIPIINPAIKEDISAFNGLIKIIQKKIKPIEKYFKIKFNLAETLFIAFHLKAALIRLENEKYTKKNVLLVCNLGPGAAKILINDLNKNFIINIVDSISYFQFQVYDLKNIDFIIHTVSELFSEIPNYKVNPILTQKDITTLTNLGFFLR